MRLQTMYLGLFIMALITGCDWSPPRNNPADPGSRNYDGPPTIENAWIETHCQELYESVCYMTIYADIRDPEWISTRDSAWAYLENELLGPMGYDPPHDRFMLSIYFKSDTLDSEMSEYLDNRFFVRFRDDAGHRCEKSARIINPISIYYGYPVLSYPGDSSIIDTLQPRFVWGYSNAFEFTFRVTCKGLNFFWENAGIHRDCTSVWMGPDDSLAISEYLLPYSWTVTVEDNDGNTATSRSNLFLVSPTIDIGLRLATGQRRLD